MKIRYLAAVASLAVAAACAHADVTPASGHLRQEGVSNGADMKVPVIPFLAVTGRPTDADIARKVAALKADGYDQFLV